MVNENEVEVVVSADTVATAAGVETTQVCDDIKLTVDRKEYVITGDDIYVGKTLQESPIWLTNYINSLTDLVLSDKLEDLAGLSEAVSAAIDSLNVAKNAYENSVITYENLELMVNAKIETLNSSLRDADATIINLLTTKVTSDQASALALNAIEASLNNGAIKSTVSRLDSAITTENESRAVAIDAVRSELYDLAGDAQAMAEATTYLRTRVGIDENNAATGTGLLADVGILQKQNDGVVETYANTYDVILDPQNPATAQLVTTAEPYASWKASDTVGMDTRLAHVGDVYVKYSTTATGAKEYISSYKFIRAEIDTTSPYATDSEGFTWALIVDQVAQDAYEQALNAYNLADGKITAYFAIEQTTTPAAPETTIATVLGKAIKVPYYWYDTTNSVLKKYVANSWTAVVLTDDNTGDQLQTMKVDITKPKPTIDYYIKEYNHSSTPRWIERTPNGLVATSEWGVNLDAYLKDPVSGEFGGNSVLESTLKAYTDDVVAPLKESGIVYRNYRTFIMYPYNGPYLPTNDIYPSHAFSSYYGNGLVQMYSLDTTDNTYRLADIQLPPQETVLADNLVDITTGALYKFIGLANQYTMYAILSPLISTDARFIALNSGDIIEDTVNTAWLYNGTSLNERKPYKVNKAESTFKYSSVLKVDDNTKYVTGFGLQSEIHNFGELQTSSEFTVQADKFKLVDPITANYAAMTSDGLGFYKAGAIEPYKMVTKIDTGVAVSGTTVTLTGFYKTPKILVSQNSIRSYSANYSGQNQRWEVRADNLQGSTATGIWTFLPVANLTLDSANTSAALNYVYSGSADTVYSTVYTTPANTVNISLSTTINSIRSTGTSGTYQKRKCVTTLQTSPVGANTWTDRNTVTTTHGADTSSDQVTVSTAIAQGQYDYRVKFVYSDDAGTFTTGTSYTYHTRTVTQGSTTYSKTFTATASKHLDTTYYTTSYAPLPTEEVISGTFSYSWSGAEMSWNPSETYDGYYQFVGLVGPGENYYSSSVSFRPNADSSWVLATGSTSGSRTIPTTNTTNTISINVNLKDAGEWVSASFTIDWRTLTLQTRMPIVESTTATNSVNNMYANFTLSSATVIDSGTVNYIAIGF